MAAGGPKPYASRHWGTDGESHVIEAEEGSVEILHWPRRADITTGIGVRLSTLIASGFL
jgi:hypothetical protein